MFAFCFLRLLPLIDLGIFPSYWFTINITALPGTLQNYKRRVGSIEEKYVMNLKKASLKWENWYRATFTRTATRIAVSKDM
jgi:hypothetical protein